MFNVDATSYLFYQQNVNYGKDLKLEQLIAINLMVATNIKTCRKMTYCSGAPHE